MSWSLSIGPTLVPEVPFILSERAKVVDPGSLEGCVQLRTAIGAAVTLLPLVGSKTGYVSVSLSGHSRAVPGTWPYDTLSISIADADLPTEQVSDVTS